MNCPNCGSAEFELQEYEERVVTLDTEAHLFELPSVRSVAEGPTRLRSARCSHCSHDCTALFEPDCGPSHELQARTAK